MVCYLSVAKHTLLALLNSARPTHRRCRSLGNVAQIALAKERQPLDCGVRARVDPCKSSNKATKETPT